jgi:acyl-coenzyme A synthetase/AMP-(fatty) acid ligase
MSAESAPEFSASGFRPLLELGAADRPMFWLRGLPVSRAGFAASVAALAERLPVARYAINVCENRFAFASAFAAAIARGQTNLLPASSSPAALAALRAKYPDSYVLWDDAVRDGVLVPRVPNGASLHAAPMIADTHPAAMVFTSGSSGEPQAHLKTWASIHHSGSIISTQLMAAFGHANVLATVPQQHMYGLETSIAVPLVSMHAVSIERPVFPEDIRSALAAMPAPRVLVTTPVHIRALLNAETRLPALAAIISATAPLSVDLAERAEIQFDAPVMEIYGSTETGSIASRRTLQGERWQLLDGVSLRSTECGSFVSIDNDAEINLQDILEIDGDGFRLIGRSSDMLKVGGKRASLADLTLKLQSIPGVIDAVVFQSEANDDTRVQRPIALVVAPGLSENEILAALAQLIDPVFLPRPLRKVAELPRNKVGKLPRHALQKLLVNA